ncbi:uncharacterized protein LOC116205836 isoform X2 [Punica granatum]|uniref:Uncharacterized protein LOC116205836 isoform X2 n=1 Tax=Punica granatum TaxID=22663 RepID=A0A6P8DQW0_PUNGR|nr:uncharacterized protein LOC116205836 isoform X2 [Punica granatum]
MFMGHTEGLSERSASVERLLPDRDSEIDDDGGSDSSEPILYTASFEELAQNHIKRHVLQKDVSSRKLYVTPTKIVYKVSRPSFIPFYGWLTIEKQVPLSLVIDIIIEQGWLQSIYGIHTFRVESIALGKAAPVDELQVQGVSDPGMLRKIIITEASKVIQAGKGWKAAGITGEGDTVARMASINEGPVFLRSPSKSLKMTASPRYTSIERRAAGVPGELLLSKLDEVSKSVKKIESLIEKSQLGPKE